jgi:glycosyltransferase involved in cell wall biosynthesis
MKQNFFSICIPVWGAGGNGIEYLETNLKSIKLQTFADFEIIISDHSLDNSLEEYVKTWKDVLNIKYFKNDIGRGSIAPNINYAMKRASGKYIKILYQDDFFFSNNSLQEIFEYIDDENDVKWLVTGYKDTYDTKEYHKTVIPMYHHNIHLGVNTIGCPSVLTIKNEGLLYLDEGLRFLDDVEFYKRCYLEYGIPDMLPSICVGCRVGGISATSLLTDEIRNKEIEMMVSKYGIIN